MLPRLLARSWPGLLLQVPSFSSLLKGVYNPRAFIPHAALLRQAFAHCAIFPPAASRRSLGRVSVPVWLIVLSDQLPVVALVGRYPTNKLIGRETLPEHLSISSIDHATIRGHPVLARVSSGYPGLRGRFLTRYSPVRHSTRPKSRLVRLAWIKHAASVRPEPGSNSPLRSWTGKSRANDRFAQLLFRLKRCVSQLCVRRADLTTHGEVIGSPGMFCRVRSGAEPDR